jgi:hypothetical protein
MAAIQMRRSSVKQCIDNGCKKTQDRDDHVSLAILEFYHAPRRNPIAFIVDSGMDIRGGRLGYQHEHK